MKLQHIALVCLLALSAGNVTAQILHRSDSIYTFTDPRLQKNTLGRAAAETFGMNVGVWAFDRYVMNEDFTKSVSAAYGAISSMVLYGITTNSPPTCSPTPITEISIQCSTQQRTYLLGINSIRLCW
mgnify:CR=1 FL=1